MKKYFSLKKDNDNQISRYIMKFTKPEFIYLPILKGTKLLTKSKHILKNELLYLQNNQAIYSPVSGTLKEIISQNEQYYLVIENDYEENKTSKKIKEEIILHSKDNTLYYNGITDDPYTGTKVFYHFEYVKEILDTLDTLKEKNNLKAVKIILKENDTESIMSFNSNLGTYPSISLLLLKDYYPIGNTTILKEYLNIPNSIILTPVLVLEYYQMLTHKEPLTDVFITISGNLIPKPKIYKVKIGTSLKEIIKKDYQELLNSPVKINNCLSNKFYQVEDIYITKNISSVLFLKKSNLKPSPCLNCGKCLSYCPMNCNPIKKINMDKCLSCGLCSYLCPSNIVLERGKNEK